VRAGLQTPPVLKLTAEPKPLEVRKLARAFMGLTLPFRQFGFHKTALALAKGERSRLAKDASKRLHLEGCFRLCDLFRVGLVLELSSIHVSIGERTGRMSPAEKEDPESEPVFTGERFIPHQTDPFLALEHYHRYFFASRFAQGKRILDIGCGEGYGSAFLSQSADAVVGIDRDEAIIDHARKKYSSIPNLTFKVGNCQDAPNDTGSFDMVVSFELLEHLDLDDQVRFLNSVRQRLGPDGLFIVSSPEKNEYAATYPVKNEFHKHELTVLELKAFLDSFFAHVHLCAQRVLSFSSIWQLEDWQHASFRFHPRKDLLSDIPCDESFSAPLYLIALCSNTPLHENVSNESNSFYLDISNSDQTKDFQRWALQLNLEAQRNRELIQNLQKQLEERTTWALNLDNRIKAQDDLIATLQKDLQERTTWALNLDNRIKAQDDLIGTLQKELESNVQQISKIRRQFVYRVLSKLRVLPNPWGK
jgi:2-polyprenyl-3-methyl-5-hydroxy-6-metoxy-1,4-benzoquinol methylase